MNRPVKTFVAGRIRKRVAVVRLQDHVSCSVRPYQADDPLIRVMIALNMKNDEVWVERINVALSRLLKLLR